MSNLFTAHEYMSGAVLMDIFGGDGFERTKLLYAYSNLDSQRKALRQGWETYMKVNNIFSWNSLYALTIALKKLSSLKS